MTQDDVLLIKRFLEQVPISNQHNLAHQPEGLLRWPVTMRLWQSWFPVEPVVRDASMTRGQYLVDAVMHCGACHTARDRMGVFKPVAYLRGAKLVSGHHAANLTPSEQGLLLWDVESLSRYLRTGKSEWGRSARDEMREYIDHSSQYLRRDDAAAIAEYLLNLAPKSDYRECVIHGPRMKFC